MGCWRWRHAIACPRLDWNGVYLQNDDASGIRVIEAVSVRMEAMPFEMLDSMVKSPYPERRSETVPS